MFHFHHLFKNKMNCVSRDVINDMKYKSKLTLDRRQSHSHHLRLARECQPAHKWERHGAGVK